MTSVTTQTQVKPADVAAEEPQTVQAPKSDALDMMTETDADTLPADNIQDAIARPAFRKSVRLATHDLKIPPKIASAALGEGDSLAMRSLRKRIRAIFGDEPQATISKDIEQFKAQVELDFREMKTGKTESEVSKKEVDLLLRTLNSVLAAGSIVDEELDDEVEDDKLNMSDLEGEDAEEVEEDLSNVDEMDITGQDAEMLLRDNVAEIEVVQEVVDWQEYKNEEEYEIMSVRKLREEEDEG